MKKHVAVIGATGYLGQHLSKELVLRGYEVTLVARSLSKVKEQALAGDHIITGDLRNPVIHLEALKGADAVISTVGITRQQDGLNYEDVDYGINHLVLNAAIKNEVRHFIYVSVLHGKEMQHLDICAAKERFVRELQASPLHSTIIRPSGFFSDIEEIYEMARKGTVYLLGDGTVQANPIHGEDLAGVCVDALDTRECEINVGGPEVLTHELMATIAFEVLGKKAKVVHIPECVSKVLLKVLPWALSKQRFGPIAFFLEVMRKPMVAPCYGKRTLVEHFAKLKEQKL